MQRKESNFKSARVAQFSSIANAVCKKSKKMPEKQKYFHTYVIAKTVQR
jgi:hypothetical protein